MKKKRIIILIVISLILVLFFVRLLNSRELDDVTPGIQCDSALYSKVDVLWVIPDFNNTDISKNKEWCDYILSLNKTIGMHGVTHEYNEFKTDRNQEYLEGGLEIFQNCFGFKVTEFKPPQIKISLNNKKLIKENNLFLKASINQITHKVYHCNDSDPLVKNWFVNLF